MSENKEKEDLDAYLDYMIVEHRKVIEEAKGDGDEELEHRAFWMRYTFMMVRDYLKHHREGGHVITAYDIAGMRD